MNMRFGKDFEGSQTAGLPQQLGVLLVEDSLEDTQLILRELLSGGFQVISERVETAAAMKAALTGFFGSRFFQYFGVPCISLDAAASRTRDIAC
jgi:hypothetical protein